jgi:hypothetical protein
MLENLVPQLAYAPGLISVDDGAILWDSTM